MIQSCALMLAMAVTPPSVSQPWWTQPMKQVPAAIAKAARTIRVDLKTQTLTAMENGEVVLTMRCCTGKNNATPKGTFPIRQKLRHNRALAKYGGAPIPYSLRLDIVRKGRRVPIAIHAYKSVPKVPSSHGCIRLTYEDAPKLFAWAEVGVPVTIE
jgi:lipoprotein-anchoring transpeptidase ErfK/SrfK